MAVDYASYKRLLRYKIPEVEQNNPLQADSAPVYPGETPGTEMWKNGSKVSFRRVVIERGKTVLNNGRAEIISC